MILVLGDSAARAQTIAGRALRGPTWVYDPTGATGLPNATWSPLAACTTWQGARRTAERVRQQRRVDAGDRPVDRRLTAGGELIARAHDRQVVAPTDMGGCHAHPQRQ